MSSGGLRCAADTDGGCSSTCTERACLPLRPSATPNSTLAPGLTVVPGGSAEACRKTSSPSSVARKPKPRSASNHLTLPVGTSEPLLARVDTPPVQHGHHQASGRAAGAAQRKRSGSPSSSFIEPDP